MTSILQGNAALAFGVMGVVFVVGCSVPMRRGPLAVLGIAALIAVFFIFQINHKLSTGEPVPAAAEPWYENAGIIACIVLIAACVLARAIHLRWPPSPEVCSRRVHRGTAQVRAHR